MATILDLNGIDEAIKNFEKCLNDKSLKIKIDVNRKEVPGLENFLYTVVELIDKIYATALGPYAKIIEIAKKIKEAITKPTELKELIDIVNKLIVELKEILKNIVEKIAEPLSKYAIPLVIPIGPLKISTPDNTVKIKNLMERIATQNYIKQGSAVDKNIVLLTFFIKIGISFITSVITVAIDALKSPTTKLIDLFSKLLKNPIKFFLDILKKIISPIFTEINSVILSIKENTPEFTEDVNNFLELIFSSKKIDFNSFKSVEFKSAIPFFALISCSITFAITFLPTAIKSILNI